MFFLRTVPLDARCCTYIRYILTKPIVFFYAQYRSTRDAVCSNPFSEWLWGGMQYQLEHHLFPAMPRYKYPRLVAQVRALCY